MVSYTQPIIVGRKPKDELPEPVIDYAITESEAFGAVALCAFGALCFYLATGAEGIFLVPVMLYILFEVVNHKPKD